MSIFEEALDGPAPDRDAFVRAACDGDADLYRDVSAMLSMDDTEHSVLDASVGLWDAVVEETASLSGHAVGPYRLIDEIGRGGMGVVYRAEREDVGTTVAVKFLRDRFPLPQHLQRFLQEQRILGQLDHPGIARFLDAGVSTDGMPYFVMEHVNGRPVVDVCTDGDLGVRDRIRLFLDVCEAVQYAHRNLIIHRDLKPSNVLIADVNGRAQVKLLDFGIAKLLEESDGRSPRLTEAGERLLTPAYAAPEQVGEEFVSTVTDVYALGVLLYEILTGVRPLDLDGLPFSDVADRIRNERPAPPSRATDPGRGGVPVAALQGDLDTICATALAKAPSDRYDSAKALRDDLEHYLNDRPIEARTASVKTRAVKFARRNRGSLVMAGMVALLLAALLSFHTLQLQEERDRARLEAAKAAQVTRFVTGLFEATRPDDAAVDTLRALTLIGRGEGQVDHLSGQPTVQAQMLSVIGDIYTRLGRYGDAERLARRAVDVYDAHTDRPTVASIAARRSLGGILLDRSQYDAAGTVLEEAVREAESMRSTHPLEYADVLNAHAVWQSATGAYAEAEATQRRVLALQRRHRGPDHLAVALTQQDLAAVLATRGDMEGAEALYRDALSTLRAAGRDDRDPALGTATQVDLADLLQDYASHVNDRGRHEEALAMHQEALAIRRTVLGADHPETAISLTQIASALHLLERYAEARTCAAEAVAIRERLFGPMHARLATALNILAINELQLGNQAEAERLLRRVAAVYEHNYGPDHWFVAVAFANLASAIHRTGNYNTSIATQRRAQSVFTAALGADHWQTAVCTSKLADMLLDVGRSAESALLARRSHDDLLAALGPEHRLTVLAAERLARAGRALEKEKPS